MPSFLVPPPSLWTLPVSLFLKVGGPYPLPSPPCPPWMSPSYATGFAFPGCHVSLVSVFLPETTTWTDQ